jgi:mono/diheme cytochrome c family protein
MNLTFWRHVHGASTHFPIVLLLASVVFDVIAWRSPDEGLRRGLHAAGFGSAVVGIFGGIGAGIAGLILTRGQVLGRGYEQIHHLFVWPALAAGVAFVGWRLVRKGKIPQRGLSVYFAGMSVTVLLMMGAGYSGGEMILNAENASARSPSSSSMTASRGAQPDAAQVGHQLFLKNCAHCHGADAHGDEGPDLHNLDWSDEQIGTRIRNGKKGQMPAFAGKFSREDFAHIITYLHALK